MKYLTVFMLLGAIAECIPEPQLLGLGGAEWPLVATKQVQPKYRTNAKRSIYSYGPITLYGKDERKPAGGFSMDPKGQGGSGSISKGLCNNCTLLSGRFLLRYKDGTPASPANGVYIHHMLSFDTSKSSKSPIGGGGGLGGIGGLAAFIDRGEDSGDTDTVFTSPDGKFNSGFHLTRPKLQVSYDVINYQTAKKEIYLDLEVEYVDGLQGKDAGHTLKSVSGTPKLNNNGPAVSESGKMAVSADSTIVWARGHLHAGGDRMVLSVNGKETCISTPKYDNAGVITTMSLCPETIPLKKGDTLSIRSVYDLSKHQLRPSTDGSGKAAHGALGGSDVMGMFAISYALGS